MCVFLAAHISPWQCGCQHTFVLTCSSGVLCDATSARQYPCANSVLPANGSCASEQRRREAAYSLRVESAHEDLQRPVLCPVSNGDETRYASTRIGSYSKGLPHDALGHVVPAAYDALLRAVATGAAVDFGAVPLGGTRRLVNPQAGLAFSLQGRDSQTYLSPPAPQFASAEAAGEAVELYWMALMRDVPFADYDTHPLAAECSAALAKLAHFAGPTTAALLFRAPGAGPQTGPYVSQFLYPPVSFGANTILQQIQPPVAGVDFLTEWNDFLRAQNGQLPSATLTLAPTRRYIITGRDLAHWVHVDVLYQAYFHAALALLAMKAPLKATNPYASSLTQDGFGTFGAPWIVTTMVELSSLALKAQW